MSLQDEIDNMKKMLAEGETKPEAEETVEEAAEETEETQEEAVETTEETPETETVEEPKAEETKDDEPKDNAAFARMRRAEAEAKRREKAAEERAAQLEAELNKLKSQPVEVEEGQAEAPQKDYVLEDLKRKHLVEAASSRLKQMEEEFAQDNPDYLPMATAYKLAKLNAIRIENPTLTAQEILEKTTEAIVSEAAMYHQKGKNPAQEFYDRAKILNLDPYVAEQPKAEPKKPKMDTVAANRARNAGMAAARGAGSGGAVTREMVAREYTNEQWAALPTHEKERLMRGG